ARGAGGAAGDAGTASQPSEPFAQRNDDGRGKRLPGPSGYFARETVGLRILNAELYSAKIPSSNGKTWASAFTERRTNALRKSGENPLGQIKLLGAQDTIVDERGHSPQRAAALVRRKHMVDETLVHG